MTWLLSHILLIGTSLGGIGLGVLGFMFPEIAGPILKGLWNLVSMAAKALGDFLKSLDAQGVVGLLVAIILTISLIHFAGDARHWRKLDARDAKALSIEKAKSAKASAQAVDLKGRIDALTSSVTTLERERTDAENARIADAADALRLSGPGKAACRSVPPAAPVRHDQTAPTNTDAGPQVPSGDWAAVPWDWLVQVVEEHDQMRDKLQAVNDQHTQLEQAWPKGTSK